MCSQKIKNRFDKALNEMMAFFAEDKVALGLIAALKEKVKRAVTLEKEQILPSKGQGTDFPLPEEAKGPKHFALFSDGACRGNPGPGAWGNVGQNGRGEVIFESSGVETSSTNNRMEMEGAIYALEALASHLLAGEEDCQMAEANVFVYSDSKYLVEGMNTWIASWKLRGWKKKDKSSPENKGLWQKLDDLQKRFWQVKFFWVKGHDGHLQNEYCDTLANRALDEAGFLNNNNNNNTNTKEAIWALLNYGKNWQQ